MPHISDQLVISTQPVMAHAIDDKGILIAVSQLWLKKMGYVKDEVIGKHSTTFLTEESKRYAEEVALPQYFSQGYIENVPYQFIKKMAQESMYCSPPIQSTTVKEPSSVLRP